MAKIKQENWGWVVEDNPRGGSWATIILDSETGKWINSNTREPVADDNNGSPSVDSNGNAILNGNSTGGDSDTPPSYSNGSPPDSSLPFKPNDVVPVAAPGVDGKTGKFTKVEPEDLSRIAAVLETLVQPLTDYSTELESIDVKAGHFNQAKNLRQLVGGQRIQGGLVDTYVTNIGNVVGGFQSMIKALNKMATLYKNADDMANGNANDVQNILSGVVNAMGGNAPNSVPGYQPPNDDDKNDDNKNDKGK
jgi:hypothetical protein